MSANFSLQEKFLLRKILKLVVIQIAVKWSKRKKETLVKFKATMQVESILHLHLQDHSLVYTSFIISGKVILIAQQTY